MIEIVKKENKKKVEKNPYYMLEYEYMIGDANGNTSESLRISLDNPFLERYVTLLKSLKPTQRTWGIVLSEENLEKHFKENQITKDDFNFLTRMMFEEYLIEEGDEDYFSVDEKDMKYSLEFFEGVIDETEYSFLVFEGINLYYYDKYGVKHNTEIK